MNQKRALKGHVCESCGNDMTAEEKIVSAIFGSNLCHDCSVRDHNIEFPAITVNGVELSKFLELQAAPKVCYNCRGQKFVNVPINDGSFDSKPCFVCNADSDAPTVNSGKPFTERGEE